MKTYTVDELFSDIPGDSANVLLTIPPETLELVGWEAGDTLNIQATEDRIILKKHEL